MEVCLGALAASLAADPKWKSVDFHLVTEILKSNGVLTAEDLALVGSGDTLPKVHQGSVHTVMIWIA